MDDTQKQILTDLQTVRTQQTNLINFVETFRMQLADLKATIQAQQVDPAAEKAMLDAVDAVRDDAAAELAKIAAAPPIVTPPVVPPAAALTGFTILLPGPAGTPDLFTVGKQFPIRIAANGSGGAVLTSYIGTVAVTAGAAQPTYKFTTTDAGQHDFAANFSTPGAQTISVTDVDTGTLSSITVTVVAAQTPPVNPPSTSPATHLEILLPPNASALKNGVPFSLQVIAARADGTTDTGYLGSVHIASPDLSDFGTNPGQDYTFVAADAGSKLFNHLVPSHAGGITVTASDAAGINGTFTATVG